MFTIVWFVQLVQWASVTEYPRCSCRKAIKKLCRVQLLTQRVVCVASVVCVVRCPGQTVCLVYDDRLDTYGRDPVYTAPQIATTSLFAHFTAAGQSVVFMTRHGRGRGALAARSVPHTRE